MIVALIAACTASSTPTLTLAGSSTIQPLAEVAAEAFEASHPEARIEVQGGGSGVGISAARSGLADIGMVSRDLRADEADLQPFPIARDGIALVVHRDNPTAALSSEQIAAIYEGRTTEWPHGGTITVVNKEEGRSTRELFEQHFGLAGRFRDDLVVIGPNGQAIATVAADPNALAYVSIGSALFAAAEGTPVRLLPLDGVEPTVAAVREGRYPLSRALNLVTRSAPEGLARAFIDFVRSPEGQALVVRQDFVPLDAGAGDRDAAP